MLPTDLTVSAVVEQDGSFLIIEETVSGKVVITQPGGHIETGESPEEATRREVFEEAACDIDVTDLIGVYLWIHPQTGQQFLRIVYAADLVRIHGRKPPDASIHSVHWFSHADLVRRNASLRSPVVLRCIDDYLAGLRQPSSMFTNLKPIQKHVDSVLANARLI